MAPKLTRVFQRIFGGSAPASPSNMAQFGSFANGTPTFTTDPAVIQALGKWLLGWNSAIVGGDAPAIEDMNAAFFVAYRQLVYIFQQGMPEYDASTEYFIGSMATEGSLIYISKTDNNIGNTPSTSPTNWKSFAFASGTVNVWCAVSTYASPNYTVTPSIPIPNPVPGGTTISFKVDTTNDVNVANIDVGNGAGPIAIVQKNGATTGGTLNIIKLEFMKDDVITLVFDDNVGFWRYAGNRIGFMPSLVIGGGTAGLTNSLTAASTDDFLPAFAAGDWDHSRGAIQIATNAAGSFDLTGIVGTRGGHFLVLRNAGPGTIVLKNQTGSAAGNQFFANADYTLALNTAVSLYYDGIGWLILGA